jgi:hypothetical protein
MPKDNKEEINAELERQAEERRKQAEENRAMLEEQRKLSRETAERAAKAEGMLEAVKTFQQMQATNGGKKEWSQAEWDEFKEKTGIGKEAIVAIDNAFGAKLADVERTYSERASKAEERAKQLENRFQDMEKTKSYDKAKSDYLRNKPQFARYEKDIDDFLSDYPAEMRNDPEKSKKLFEKAEIFIKGKVGSNEMRKPAGGSERFGSGDDTTTDEPIELDFSDLRSHERAMIEKIIPTKEREQLLKDNKHDLKGDMGVMINTRNEFEKYNKK